MKKTIIGISLCIVLATLLTGCGDNRDSLKNILKKYDKINENMTSGEVTKKLGAPSSTRENTKASLVSYLYSDGALIVDFKDGKAVAKQIYYTSNNENNILVGKQLGTEIEDLTSIISNIEEGMTLEEVVKILGDKYIETLSDWHYEYNAYTWYDKKENHVEIEFDKRGKVDYIYDIVTFSDEK